MRRSIRTKRMKDNRLCRKRLDDRVMTARRLLKTLFVLFFLAFAGEVAFSCLQYSRRAAKARILPDNAQPDPGRVYFASFPRNRMVIGFRAEIGHASLVIRSSSGRVLQYDYGCFPSVFNDLEDEKVVGYRGGGPWFGLVIKSELPGEYGSATDREIAVALLKSNESLGGAIELWGLDVQDVGIAVRYIEALGEDPNRGRFLLGVPGGYTCGTVARQAFDAARGGWHILDLLWGGFPGADAPSIGTEKTIYHKIE